jgi:hypothetical protein
MSENETEKSSDSSSLMEKLDKCACLYVECYEQLLAERVMLDNCLDDAYLHLSKARSVMGCATLSITQVPSEIEPSVRVNLTEQNHVSLLDEERLMFKSNKFDLVIEGNVKETETIARDKDDDEEQNEESSISSNLSNLSLSGTSHLSPSSKVAPSLPTWFGVLTPLNLKTSHKSFSRSLYHVAYICELQSKLDSLKSTYQELLKQKRI